MVRAGTGSPPRPGWYRVASGFAFLLCLLAFTRAAAQVADQVHVVPLARPVEATPAPAPPPAELDPSLASRIQPLRVDVDLVLVPVTITDQMNRAITGLGKQDFALYEDGVQQEIRFFSAEDSPISVGVILDLSKSMSNKLQVAREAAGEFFKTANPQDDYFVITFSDRPAILADSTRSIGYIQGKLASAVAGGHTALLDAIYLGVAKMRQASYQRRALLIISDGGDNHSRYRASEIKSLVEEADVQIYAIGIFDTIFQTPEEWAGKRLLTGITEATGGRTITLGSFRKLPEVARAISLELRNQYVLGYRPSNPVRDGKWRTIKVRLTPSPAAVPRQVYARKGYLATEE